MLLYHIQLVYTCCLKPALSVGFFKSVDMRLPIWTAPVYVYPISMHFGTFQLELIGDCYPLHILHLSPALYRLTEVVLILLRLPTNSTVCRLVQGRAMLLHLREFLLKHGIFFITFAFYLALSRGHFFFIAWTHMARGTMVTSSITIRTYLLLLWERVNFLNREFGRCRSEGFINITSLVIDSIGDGQKSSVFLNSEQIHQRSVRMEI